MPRALCKGILAVVLQAAYTADETTIASAKRAESLAPLILREVKRQFLRLAYFAV